MEISIDTVAARLTESLDATGTPHDSSVSQCAADAAQLVGDYIGANKVPESIALLAAVEVARELHTRLSAPGGVLSPFAEATPIRLARDPMKAAYPLLNPYLPGGFA